MGSATFVVLKPGDPALLERVHTDLHLLGFVPSGSETLYFFSMQVADAALPLMSILGFI